MDTSELGRLIDALSSPAQVSHAEAQLEQACSQSPLTLLGLARLGNEATTSDSRCQSLILLKRFAFRKDLTNHGIKQWTLLDAETQAVVQGELLKALIADERESPERHVACDLAKTIYQAKEAVDETWTNLIETAVFAIQQPALHIRETGYLIFAALPTALLNLLSTTDGAILNNITAELPVPAQGPAFATVAAFDAACMLLSVWADGIKTLWPALMQTIAGLTGTDDIDSCLKNLVDLLAEHIIVEKVAELGQIQPLLTLCTERAAVTTADPDNRAQWIEVAVTLAETAPHIFSTQLNAQLYAGFVQTCLSMMTEVVDDPEWAKKEEEEDDSISPSVVGETALDRLAQGLDEVLIFPIGLQGVEQLIQSGSWQQLHAALSAVAVLAEGCAHGMEAKAEEVMTLIQPCFTHQHPRVRHAALYALAQLCSFLEGKLQTEMTEGCLEILINSLQDPESRLRGWACSALVNFFDLAMDAEGSVKPLLETLYQALFQLAQKDVPAVQGRALAAISAFAISAGTIPAAHYDTLMPFLKAYLAAEGDGKSVTSAQGCAMDCAAHVAIAAGTERIASDADDLYRLFGRLCERAKQDEDKSTVSAALTALVTLTIVASAHAGPYLNSLTSQLLQAASAKIDVHADLMEGSDLDLVEIDGHIFGVESEDIESVVNALDTLDDLLNAMRGQMGPAAQQILAVAVPLLKCLFSDDIRKGAAALLPAILMVAKEAGSSEEDINRLFIYCFESLVDAFGAEDDPILVTTFFESIYSLCTIVPSRLEPKSAELFVACIEKQIQHLSMRVSLRQENPHDMDGVEESEATDEAMLEACSLAFKGFIGQHPPGALIERLSRDLVIEAATAPGPMSEIEAIRRWAIRWANDLIMLEGASGASLVINVEPLIYNELETGDAETRRTAAYAIGSIAQHGQGAYNSFLERSLESLVKACAAPRQQEALEATARDNAVSALGKLLQFAPPAGIDTNALTSQWLGYLPIEHDFEELESCLGFLLALISKGHPAIDPSQSAVAEQVVKVLGAALYGETACNLQAHCLPPIRSALSVYVKSCEHLRSALPVEVQSQLE